MTTLQPIHDALSVKRTQLAAARQAAADASRDVTALTGEIRELEQAAVAGKPLELAVTDHALLRYAERVLGYDRGPVVALIGEKVGPVAMCLGDGNFPLCPGFHAVVRRRTVVTIEPAGKWVDESPHRSV